MAPILTVRNLSTGYGKKQVLFGVTLCVEPGEILLIIGGNGSGKSTLLKSIYGLLAPWNDDAEVVFRPDADRPGISTEQPNLNLRNGLAYLPQKHGVFDDLTTEENLRLAGHTMRNSQEYSTRRDEVLALLPAIRPFLRQKPETLSGGERQIVALAMALLHRPKLLLLDEPTAGLDKHMAEMISQTLAVLSRSRGVSAIVVEHRVSLAETIADRAISLRLGRVQDTAELQRQLSITL